MITIAFTGGGTAGHVFPGFAVLKELSEKGICNQKVNSFWIGGAKGMEKDLLGKSGISFYGIPCGKLRRYFSIHNFFDLFKIFAGMICSLRILSREKPALLFSKGGFVSVPPVIAAGLLKIPVITHESDITPGLATRIGSRFAKKVLTSFDETKKYFPKIPGENLIFTGNPVRPEIVCADPDKGLAFFPQNNTSKRLLILGGSQGARQVNELISEVAKDLVQICSIVHQCGSHGFVPPQLPGYKAHEYIDADLPHILACANIVVARAGATTLAELSAAGKPSVLIPLGVGSSRGDQIVNSRYFTAKGASISFEGQVSPQDLLKTIRSLLDDPKKCIKMGASAKNLNNPDAAKTICRVIENAIANT